jgi:polysaccharide biosynthesis transport protein
MPEPNHLQLPAPNLPVPADYYRVGPAWDSEPPEPPSVPLAHYLWIIKRHRWKIFSFIFAAVAATWIISSRITPVYESTAKIDIDRQMPTGVIGQEAVRTTLNDSDQFLATQVNLIQSDSVLRPVAQQYKLLEIEGQGQSQVSEDATLDADAPVLLKNLKVTRPPNTYILLISYRSADRRLAADVANAVARSYLEHTYTIRIKSSASLSAFMEKQLEELRAKMERSSAALVQFERELNVINPEEKTNILSTRLLQLNTDYTKAQSERIGKEAGWRSVQGGSLDAAAVSSQGEILKKIAERLNETQQKFADVQTHYGENHPEYRKVASQLVELQRQYQSAKESIVKRVEVEYREAVNREAMLQKSVAETKKEYDSLNARSFEYQSRKREAEADKSLYEELVRKIKEAGINAGFQNSNIRIADNARPAKRPVFPDLRLNLVLAFLFSSLLAVGASVLSDTMDNTIRDPDQAKALLNIDVAGTLPQVKPWRGKLIPLAAADSPATLALVKQRRGRTRAGASTSGFEEAIRSLRNSILLSNVDRPMKSLMVTSASPSEGKSTTAIHLALAHAQQKHKTLLIDGDFRRPGIHRRLGMSTETGLSAALQNGLNWHKEVLKVEAIPGLDVLLAGQHSRVATDLLGSNLHKILAEASTEYDLIIIDAPPVLGFSESLQMATAVDGVVMVAKAGETNRRAVTSAVSTLQRLHANVVGLVLNEVTKDMSDGYSYYGYYGKYYKYYKAAD